MIDRLGSFRCIVCLVLGLFIGSFVHSNARTLLRHSPTLFAQGTTSLQKGQYKNAQRHFEAYMCHNDGNLAAIAAKYYLALCAIKLGQPDSTQYLQQFIKAYPQHHKAPLAHYQLGNLYFRDQDFAKSITYHLQVNKNALEKSAQEELQYRLAYAYLHEQDFEQAKAYFDALKTHENEHCYAASYYAGYIALKNEDYTTALEDLLRASEHINYQAVVPYLIVQVYYKQKHFQELLSYVHQIQHTNIDLHEKEEIRLLMAEAYFFTGDYAEAAKYYEMYKASKDVVVSQEIVYRTAYAFYKAEEAEKALRYFKELAMQEDRMGQSAGYYAGLLYLKANQKRMALAAFDKARKVDFCVDIQEEAAFYYAKVSYELGHFTTAIEAFKQFKESYGASKHLSEANSLLGEAYLRTNDYDLAIVHIEGLAKKPQRTLQVYQKATFCKGSEYFNNADYAQAICLFQKSLDHPLDQVLSLQTQFWLSESLSALQQYEKAITVYQSLLDSLPPTDALHPQVVYGLGYAYFNSAHYTQALPQFLQYIRHQPDLMPALWRQDALVRLADCYYATKQYQQALQSYEQVLSYQPAYVHYQKGMIYGILNDMLAAQASFQAIFKNYVHTIFYEKALFEIANMDFVHNNYPQAIERFTEFIQKKPQSPLLPDALLKRAVSHVNLGKYSQATQDYGRLLTEHSKHPNARSALLELPKFRIYEGNAEQIDQYLAHYESAHPDSDTLEKVTFDTAKALFYDQRYTDAVEQLQAFLTRYPTSVLLPEASFLIAEAYYRKNDVLNALNQYKIALKGPSTPFYNKILLRIGGLLYNQKDFEQAFEYYQRLNSCATSQKENYYALAGMVRASHALRHYEAMQQYASEIIEKGNLSVNATSEATLFLGKAAMQQKKYQAAQAYFRKVIKNNQGHHAAEAMYLLAQLHYKAQEYQQSLAVLFELTKQFSAYKIWKNKSFLLIAENYLALQENFQAKATLQSIIENAEEEAIVTCAKRKLAMLQKNNNFPPAERSDTNGVSLRNVDE